MRNGERASLDLAAFDRAVQDALVVPDKEQSAAQLSSLGIAWLNGFLAAKTETVDPALRCFEAALLRRTSESDPEQVARDHYHLGAAYLLSEPLTLEGAYGALQEFEPLLDPAYQISDWLRASAFSSSTAAMRHLALAGKEPYEKVRALAEKAVPAWREHGEPGGLAKALLNAGNAQVDDPRGDPDENADRAYDFYLEAITQAVEANEPVLEAGCRMAAALALRDRASYHPEVDLSDAAELLEQSRSIYEDRQMVREGAEVVVEIGGVLVHERSRYHRSSSDVVRTAITMLEDALSILSSFPHSKRIPSGYFYLGQAWLELQDEEGDAARGRAISAFQMARRLRSRSANVVEMAQFEEAQANALSEGGNPEDHRIAARLYRKAINRLGSQYPVQCFRMLCNFAFGKMQVGLWRGASMVLREAAELLNQSEFLEAKRKGLFREGRVSECFSALAVCEAQMGHLDRAIEVLEQSRDIAHEKGKPVTGLKAFLERKRTEVIVLPMLSPVGSAAIVIPPGVTRLTREHLFDLPNMEMLRASIQPYRSRGEDGFLAKVERWRNDTSPQGQQAREGFLDELLQELWTGFIAPILVDGPGSSCSSVIVVPHGGFHIFPVHAAYHAVDNARVYACDRWTIHYAPSLISALNRLAEEPVHSKSPLCVGLSRYRDPRLRKLALAEEEVRRVVESLGCEDERHALIGPAVTREAVLERIARADVLHFACHATLDRDPANSALQLWAAASGERSTLNSEEIEDALYGSKIRITILSACDSGVMEHMFSADELAGLPSAFLRAGCGGVISSLWPVSDLASYFLWPRFYTELGRGLMPAEALAGSIRWLRESTQEELLQLVDSPVAAQRLQRSNRGHLDQHRPFSHPWLWAPFVLYGN